MATQKKKGMTREQAAELYSDLQKAMSKMKAGGAPRGKGSSSSGIDAKAIAQSISAAMKRDTKEEASTMSASPEGSEGLLGQLPVTQGQYMAIVFVLLFAVGRVAISAMEATGFAKVDRAEATVTMASRPAPVATMTGLSKEEIKILTSLDVRRSELEDRSQKLDERQADIERRDREFAVRLTQLRELTQQLGNEREKTEKKKTTQLEQLANVYGSMNPPEAAALLQQLDATIALGLLERMPEKRIGQILALMSPEHALTLTKMLSSRTR